MYPNDKRHRTMFSAVAQLRILTLLQIAAPTLMICASLGGWNLNAQDTSLTANGATVVLVHGAFADGSSWAKVIPLLESKGLRVVAVQNPLTSLRDDVAATRRVITQQRGAVVLVGHSWGGAVITEAGADDKVKALVYVAAFAPSEGQSINEVLRDAPTPPWTSALIKDSGGFLTLTREGIKQFFAQDLAPAEARIVAATQGPWFSGCADEKVSVAAWRSKPSWDLITEADHMIPPSIQEANGKRIRATLIRLPAGHLVMLSKPHEVATAILSAAVSIQGKK